MNGTKSDVQLNFLLISKKTDELALIIDTYIYIDINTYVFMTDENKKIIEGSEKEG
jgi:hypothetical protein